MISDLVTDQRVHKVCMFLYNRGFDVTLIGRKHNQSKPLNKRSYKTERVHCFFSKGTLLYAEFMTKLFFKILFKKTDIFLSNDLDTLLPNFLLHKLRSKKLVYDSHEYFTGTPELQSTPLKKKIWQTLEKTLLPGIKNAYTVNQSIAQLYKTQYGIEMKVVRNVPYLQTELPANKHLFPEGRMILLLQGSGINEGRGAEELVESMKHLPDNFLLCLIGGGDCWEKLKQMSEALNLHNKVLFIERVPFEELRSYTSQAHLGLSLDKPVWENQKLSLPNKIFDYIHAGLPVLASDVIEVRTVLEQYNVGTTIKNITPEEISTAVLQIFENRQRYQLWKQNTLKAASELCWQNEEKVLESIFINL